jgi:tetratricopeptide (TPR) repeat protein
MITIAYNRTERIRIIEKWYQATKIHYEMDARIKFHSGQYAGAIAAASRAIALEPAFAPAYNLRGKSHAMRAEYRAAIEDFSMVIRLNPNHAEGYRNLGFAHLLSKDKQASIPYLEKSLALDPHDSKVKAALTKLLAGEQDGS